MAQEGTNYIVVMVAFFVALVSVIGVMFFAYFGGLGLFLSQGVVEGEVWPEYRYTCVDPENKTSECTEFNTSVESDSFTQYEEFTEDVNDNATSAINSGSIFFSLITLVALGVAIRELRRDTKQK